MREQKTCCVAKHLVLPRFYDAGDEGSLHLGHSVVDGDACAFVQDFHAVDLHRGGGAVFGRAGQGDVEGQDLIGVPGLGELLHAVDRSHRGGDGAIQVSDCGAEGNAAAADQGGVEDRALRQIDVLVGVELGTDVVDIGDEGAAQLPDQVQKSVTVEVDPDQAVGDAALVTGEAAGDKNRRVGGSTCFGSFGRFVRLLTYRQYTCDNCSPASWAEPWRVYI